MEKLTKQHLINQICEKIDLEPSEVDCTATLMDYGLDSLQVMELIEEWDGMGIDVDLDDLAETPTINAWWNLIRKDSN